MADSLRSPLLSGEAQNGAGDMLDIHTCRQFTKECWIESKKLWLIGAPSVFTGLCTYGLGSVTQAFVGHLGTLELAAVAIEISVISGLGYGTMMGMGSALETICGQAFGAGEIQILGVYMQRSWIILLGTALLLSLVYLFASPLLKLMGQTDAVADLAGVFAIWMLPQLLALALNFPMQKFLQAQRKVMVMASICLAAMIIHVFLSWFLIFKVSLGLAGAAISLNLSWWIIDIFQFLYIVYYCQDAWRGFSWLAFHKLWAFVGLSFASAVMICLEFWYPMTLMLVTGHLQNATIEVDAISICMNLAGWVGMIFFGFNIATSVRVSNELGAGHPKAAKFSVLIVVVTALLLGILFMVFIIVTKSGIAVYFTDSKVVMEKVSNMTLLLGLTMLLYSVQPVLSGVAVGGGWQALIAYVNIGCYYIVGIPIGILFTYKLDLGAKGMWSGMLCGITLSTVILLLITLFTNWKKEAAQAEDRLTSWGRSAEGHTNETTTGYEGNEDVERQNRTSIWQPETSREA